MNASALVWFRLDLRLADNPALSAAAAYGNKIVPVFIWAPGEEGDWPPGAASRWWFHHSLTSLDDSLNRHGLSLIIRQGSSLDTLRSLIKKTGARSVYWNRRYEPALRSRDVEVERALLSDGVRVETFNSSLLFEPDKIKNKSGKPFRIFTPFWKACLSAAPDFLCESIPAMQQAPPLSSRGLDTLRLQPEKEWAKDFVSVWQPGETGAQNALRRFFDESLDDYPEQRDYPAVGGTSRLSPHLHFGEISPRQVWAVCARKRNEASKAFRRQLGWREFAHHLLYHFPHTATEPLRSRFSRFPWREDPVKLRAWQRGRTGFPIVDAGMRELWTTGWMHNRARMIVGSFLVKDLLLPWQEGARWFWDTLVDADLANNTLGWQWIAGCGADAAPYFRIFNPAAQAKKFDPKGEYISSWVSESGTPDYPSPIVNHAQARDRALDALAEIKRK